MGQTLSFLGLLSNQKEGHVLNNGNNERSVFHEIVRGIVCVFLLP